MPNSQLVQMYLFILGVFTAFSLVLGYALRKALRDHLTGSRVAQWVGKVETSTFPNFPFGGWVVKLKSSFHSGKRSHFTHKMLESKRGF